MSILSELFGDCPQLKVLETFIENPNDKQFIADISRITGINTITVTNHINKLLLESVIEKKDKAGRVQFYQLNMDNQKVKIIMLLENYIVSEKLDELLKEK